MTHNPTGLAPRCLAAATALLGAELIVGWLLHIEAMVRILPASNSVSFNTALFFLLAGLALACDDSRPSALIRLAAGGILVVGTCLIFYEDVFDTGLGLDWETLHRVVLDGSPRPGRVAPNTCLALLMTGVSLLLLDKPTKTLRRSVVASCLTGQVLLIATGVVGLLLDPTLMFGWYKFNRMAAPTAAGLALLAFSIFLRYRLKCAATVLSPMQHHRTILLTGSMLLLCMGLAGAMTTFVIFANSQQQAIQNRLQAELTGQVRLADIVMSRAGAETQALTVRPLLHALMTDVAKNHLPADEDRLRATFASLLPTGFTSLSLRWADGTPGIDVGTPTRLAGLALGLQHRRHDQLVWDGSGFVYRASVLIRGIDGTPIADLTTESALPGLNSIYHPVTMDASSAEIFICGQSENTIACFPSRLHPSTLILPPRAQRPMLPVDSALAGVTGIRVSNDYRGIAVVAAYSQIGKTGLALISKVDATQIYAPINALLAKTMIVLAIALFIGTWLLHNLIGPLLQTVLASQAEAIKSARRIKAITDNVPVLIGFLDKNLVYRFVNKTYETWFGVSAGDVVGRTPAEVLEPGHLALALPKLQKALAGETITFSMVNTSGLATYPKYVTISYIPDRGADGTIDGLNVFAFDDTERRDHEQALAHIAHHDSLTELPNRRLFEDRLERALLRGLRSRKPPALFYLDVDRFKQINDEHGHDCGDMLLRAFAKRLQATVRRSDTIARLGGDEFVILAEDLAKSDDAERIAQNILRAVRAPFCLGDLVLSVTTSIGISFADRPAISSAEFLSQSDQALYAAKHAGRNAYSVYRSSAVHR